jgi:molecular chaperone Hsp33
MAASSELSLPADQLLRAVSEDGDVAVRALVATGLVAEAARRHETGPLASAALGRALLGAELLGSLGKDDETVQVHFRGRGPLRGVLATADAAGRARGYVGEPRAALPLRGGKLDVARAVGLGELAVVRHRASWREPYTGIVPIVSGEIAEDLALYLTESEQTPSAVALGVALDAEGRVAAAGGILAQALPGARAEAVARLEANVRALAPASSLAAGDGAEAMLAGLLQGLGVGSVSRTVPTFHCGCDPRRVMHAVLTLGRDALDEHVARSEHVEVRCHFCAERYRVDPAEARALLEGA